jgi:hypothetical protein
MLSAIRDYYHYMYAKGPYAHEVLCEQGLFLATPEIYKNYKNTLPPTIVFVSTLNSFVSWLIMYVTNGRFSHVATLYSKEVIFDCTPKGVHFAPLQTYFVGNHYLYIQHLPDVDLHDFRVRANSMLGGRYNYFGALNLGLSFITGVNPRTRWRLAIDTAIFLTIFSLLFSFFRHGFDIFEIFTIPAVYLIIYSFNRRFRQWQIPELEELRMEKDRAMGVVPEKAMPTATSSFKANASAATAPLSLDGIRIDGVDGEKLTPHLIKIMQLSGLINRRP